MRIQRMYPFPHLPGYDDDADDADDADDDDAVKIFEEKEKGDVVVFVEGCEVRAHSVIHGLASPVSSGSALS